MTQRIHDRLNGEFCLDNEILVRAIRTRKYIDQFTTEHDECEAYREYEVFCNEQDLKEAGKQ